MADPTVTSLKVYYTENGKNVSRTIRFLGNFGFNLERQNSNGGTLQAKQFKVKDGHVYDSNGKLVQGLKMPKEMAYQFIGMSNTAELASDYTYSAKDIEAAKNNFSNSGNNTLINSILGTGATQGVSNGYAKYEDGRYTTNYHHIVSVWQEK